MWTTWAPIYLIKEKEIGTLEVGKLADFTVLDKDFFTIPVPEILKIRPQMTVLGGKITALQAGFAGTLGMEPVGYQFPDGYYPWDRNL
jgi:imidazolonepropionase-like amidohydrolase